MANFDIALSALRTSKFAMGVVSNNVANANTEGYHRRVVHMRTLEPTTSANFRIGTGVEVSNVQRIRDRITEDSLTQVISDSNHVDQVLALQRNMESALMAGDNTIGRQLDNFLGEFTKLSGAPNDPSLRTSIVESANQLAVSLRDASQQLDELRQSMRLQIQAEVDALNVQMEDLSSVSQKIFEFSNRGLEHNTELDERDQIINQIAEQLGITRREAPDGNLQVNFGTQSIQQGNRPNQVSVVEQDGQIELRLDDAETALPVETGRLGAIIQAYNELIPDHQENLDQVAAVLIQQVNSIHAAGVGEAGSFEHLIGNTIVSNVNIPLAEALPEAGLVAGEINVTVHGPGGDREVHSVAFDPASQSLTDLADALNLVSGLNASVRPNTNQLQITASAGYTFDFAGGTETHPDTALITGASVPELSGDYSGTANEEITVRIEGSGEVGNATDLFANVYGSGGSLLARVSLGTGYEPGSAIELENDVRLSFASGTLNDADEFTAKLAGNGDTTGALGALGVNAFFTGINARTIDLDDTIRNQPDRIATGRTGEAGDSSNLQRFIALEGATIMPEQRTMTSFVAEFTSELGFDIQSNTKLSTSLTNYKLRLEQQRDSKSGVDLNEELVYLQQYQKSYEAAVRVIQVTDQMLDDLFSMLR